MDVILASSSPRRKELLKKIVSDFKIIPSNVDEIFDENMDVYNISMYLAKLKAMDIAKDYPNSLVIGCDTIVWCDNQILLKPTDYEDATRMLNLLSDNNQEIISGVCLVYNDNVYTFYDVTKIKFAKLDDKWIHEYISSGEPFDKSGGYGIQGLDDELVEDIDGDIDNVIGLPTLRLRDELHSFISELKK